MASQQIARFKCPEPIECYILLSVCGVSPKGSKIQTQSLAILSYLRSSTSVSVIVTCPEYSQS